MDEGKECEQTLKATRNTKWLFAGPIVLSAGIVLAMLLGFLTPAQPPEYRRVDNVAHEDEPTTTVVAQTSPTPAGRAMPTAPTTSTPTPAVTITVPPGEEGPLALQPVILEVADKWREGPFTEERTLNLPEGFRVKVFAGGLKGVRWLALSPDGLIYATQPREGRVVILPDANNDGVADEIKVFADDLPGVHGIDFMNGYPYVATERQVIRLEDTNHDHVADNRVVLVDDLPVGGNHKTRTILFGPDGKMYLSMGSECNACIDKDPRQAAISRYTADGKFEKVYAKGLRNAVGIIFHPITGELWATNNGRDMLGDELPPETIYNVKEGADYGYPFCYGDQVPDVTQNPPPGYCEKTGRPAVQMQAHSAPLGLAFYFGDLFPARFKEDMFVAFHGSWNRSELTGYKLVRVRFRENQPDRSAGPLLVEDFATGWLVNGKVWGRPVHPFVLHNGSMLLTDDYANAIYLIYYENPQGGGRGGPWDGKSRMM